MPPQLFGLGIEGHPWCEACVEKFKAWDWTEHSSAISISLNLETGEITQL